VPARRVSVLCLVLLLPGCTGRAGRVESVRIDWVEQEPPNRALPPGIRLLSGVSPDLPLRSWAVTADPRAPGVRFGVAMADDEDGLATPTELARSEGACVLVNGGFYRLDGSGRGRHIGLLVRNGERKARALDGVVWQQVRYPVARAAIGADSTRIPRIVWVGATGDTVRTWTEPFENALGRPAIAPAPERGTPWFPEWALSAGPALVENGQIHVTRDEEAFFEPHIPRVHPRSAAGVTADGHLVLLVVDGRQSLSRGAYLEELGAILKDLGVRWALNLDGGGSSALVVNGQLVNRPSDSRGEREIVSAITITCTDDE